MKTKQNILAKEICVRLCTPSHQMDVAAMVRPAGRVGGDLALVEDLADGRTFFAVADVTGKGPRAAAAAKIVEEALRRNLHGPLMKMVHRVGLELIQRLPEGCFVTMCCGTIDPVTGDGEMFNAGHPPCVIADHHGICRQMPCAMNLPLGILPEAAVIQPFHIAPGESIVLYSDGLSEWRNSDGSMHGCEGMLGIIASATSMWGRRRGASGLVNRILAECGFAQWTERNRDDCTLLVARRTLNNTHTYAGFPRLAETEEMALACE